MSKIEELEKEIEQMQQQLAALVSATDETSSKGQALRNEWMRLAVAADVDGDENAAQRAAVLETEMMRSEFADQRRQLAIAALQNRIQSKRGEILRAKETRPCTFERRRAGVPVGQLTRWARGLPEVLGGGGWEPVTEDRVRYELSRCFGSDGAAVMRQLREGGTAKTWDFEIRATVQE